MFCCQKPLDVATFQAPEALGHGTTPKRATLGDHYSSKIAQRLVSLVGLAWLGFDEFPESLDEI